MKILAIYRCIVNKINNHHPLKKTFINTKPKLQTINPDIKLSYNETFKFYKKTSESSLND